MLEMARIREKIEAICARNQCDYLVDSFEAICKNTSVMLMCVSQIDGEEGRSLQHMALTSLALDLKLIERCTNRKVSEAFAECFTEASNSLDESVERARK